MFFNIFFFKDSRLFYIYDLIIDYCANKDNAPDKSVSKDRFEQEIGSAFDILFNSWLQITKEMKVFILYENNSFFRERCFIMK
jgi:hypothetical protein